MVTAAAAPGADTWHNARPACLTWKTAGAAGSEDELGFEQRETVQIAEGDHLWRGVHAPMLAHPRRMEGIVNTKHSRWHHPSVSLARERPVLPTNDAGQSAQ